MFPKPLRYAADDSMNGDDRKIINSIHCFFFKKKLYFCRDKLYYLMIYN